MKLNIKTSKIVLFTIFGLLIAFILGRVGL